MNTSDIEDEIESINVGGCKGFALISTTTFSFSLRPGVEDSPFFFLCFASQNLFFITLDRSHLFLFVPWLVSTSHSFLSLWLLGRPMSLGQVNTFLYLISKFFNLSDSLNNIVLSTPSSTPP